MKFIEKIFIKIRQHRILKYAKLTGCDWDGDLVRYNSKKYIVNISRKTVIEVK